ncbi:hypothetical protein KKJ04_22830, partial [Xenorhabdus bovienii]|nr:hypothetical protein [Xenorhabdus bovienii]
LHGSLDAEGYVKSGEGFDVVSSRDIWAGGRIWENKHRVYSPNNKPRPEEIDAYPMQGGILHGNLESKGYVKSGDNFDVVSSRDIWASRYIFESGQRVYSPSNTTVDGNGFIKKASPIIQIHP